MPLIWVLYKLPNAFTHQDFNALSNAVKLVILAGVLSMLFFYFLK